MMNDTFTEKISLWLDDQLNANEAVELETHLANCATCQAAHQAMQQAHHLLLVAGAHMAAPAPGFTQRFEARLARHRPQASKPWQLWLATAALLLGAVAVFGGWLLAEGLVWINAGSYLVNAQILYLVLSRFIESLAGLQFVFNFAALLVRTSFIIIAQPLFWGVLLIAISTIGLWLWLMQTLARRTAPLSVL